MTHKRKKWLMCLIFTMYIPSYTTYADSGSTDGVKQADSVKSVEDAAQKERTDDSIAEFPCSVINNATDKDLAIIRDEGSYLSPAGEARWNAHVAKCRALVKKQGIVIKEGPDKIKAELDKKIVGYQGYILGRKAIIPREQCRRVRVTDLLSKLSFTGINDKNIVIKNSCFMRLRKKSAYFNKVAIRIEPVSKKIFVVLAFRTYGPRHNRLRSFEDYRRAELGHDKCKRDLAIIGKALTKKYGVDAVPTTSAYSVGVEIRGLKRVIKVSCNRSMDLLGTLSVALSIAYIDTEISDTAEKNNEKQSKKNQKTKVKKAVGEF